MKKIFFIISILYISLNNIFGRPINEKEALLKAETFSQKAVSARLMKMARTQPTMKLAYVAQETEKSYFYIFNRGMGDGYVIVAAEDRANEILGYTDSGTFDYDNIPENMKWWLGEYRNEIEYLIEHPEIESKTAETNISESSVAPLLGTTAWNQSAPYNDKCPMYDDSQRCVTGCVATAMAQIMYYHQWPSRGTGSHSYSVEINGTNHNLSADFGNTIYEWDKMTPTYTDKNTQESKNAVATLMSHCGISLDMEYGLSSGAKSYAIPYALYTYFGYDKGMTYKSRNYYGITEWENIMRNELDAKRVLQYNGQSSSGGHSFVCDGYNKDGYFHINWGWGGSSNGYYKTTALTPGTQGIGGGNGGYNYSQGMTTGICKADENSTEKYEIYADSGTVPLVYEFIKGRSMSLTINGLWNMGWNSASIEFALVLYDTNNGKVAYTQSQTGGKAINLAGMHGWKTFDCKLQIPTSITAGNYKLYTCYRTESSDVWEKVRVAVGEPQYIDVEISGNNVSLKQSSTETPVLHLEEILQNTKLFKNKNASFTAKIGNTGGEYYGSVNFVFWDKVTNALQYTSSNYTVNIKNQETKTIEFFEKLEIAPGEYRVGIIDKEGSPIGNKIDVTVNDEPGAPALILKKKISFPNNDNVPKNDMKLLATIQNTGGYYYGNLTAYIFPEEGGSSISILSLKTAMIDENETQEVIFDGSFEDGSAGTRYLAAIYDNISKKWMSPNNFYKCVFTLGSPVVSIDEVTIENRVYPNPVTDYITVESEKRIKRISVYSISGDMVSDTITNDVYSQTIDLSSLSSGNYLVLIVTDQGNAVKKISKK